MDNDEDVYTASGEEDIDTGTEVDNSIHRFIDEHRQIELDLDESFDSDADSYDSLEHFFLEMEDLDHQADFQIDEIDAYFEQMNSMDERIDQLLIDHQIIDDEMDLFPLDDGMDRLYESDMEESIDTDTDEHDSTEELDVDMSHALSQMASSLCLSVDDGCRLCMAVAQSLEDFCKKPEAPVTQNEFWTIRSSWKPLPSHYTRARQPGAHVRSSAVRLRFRFCRCERDHRSDAMCKDFDYLQAFDFYPARKLGPGPEFLDPTLKTSSAKSAASFAVAKSWYQQCLNHTTCRNWRQQSRILPTRLIEIRRPDNQSTSISAKICETKDLPSNTRYVTLSHCWGKGVIFKLLQDNLQELSQAIPIGQLPNVFQDAIRVSHELGIRYIWIDSLCIIQDSKEDWTFEAKRMGDVYANGEFNVAATGYEDGLSGLFGERRAFSFVNIPMEMQFELTNEDYEREAVFEGLYVAASHLEFKQHVIFGPLNSRGWVAQERVLSPAVIHYTPEKIYWECNELVANEAFPNGSYIWEDTEGSGRDRIRSLSTQSGREDVYSFWRTFIHRYAGMALTDEQDRFPAVAGIARILSGFINDNFVAGFWEGDLFRSLVLERVVPPRDSLKPNQIAPSWSWASMTNDTSLYPDELLGLEPLNGIRFRVLSDIPGFKSDLQSPSFEKSGVRGLAIKGVLRKLPDDFDEHKEWAVAFLQYDNKPIAEFLGHSIPQEQAWRLSHPTHMLLLGRRYFKSLERYYVHGLLVQVAEPMESNTFRRSGVVQLAMAMGKEFDEYLGLREKDGEYEPSLVFEESGLQDLVLI